jgi:hypothetical protein
MDDRHTMIHLRLEYDPQEITDTFGLNGTAHNGAVKQAVKHNLEKFKTLVERGGRS